VETGTRTTPQEVDRHTAEEEADTRKPAQEVDRHTAEEELGRSIPVEVVGNRDRVVEAYSTSWPTGRNALLVVSERSSRTRLTRFGRVWRRWINVARDHAIFVARILHIIAQRIFVCLNEPVVAVP